MGIFTLVLSWLPTTLPWLQIQNSHFMGQWDSISEPFLATCFWRSIPKMDMLLKKIIVRQVYSSDNCDFSYDLSNGVITEAHSNINTEGTKHDVCQCPRIYRDYNPFLSGLDQVAFLYILQKILHLVNHSHEKNPTVNSVAGLMIRIILFSFLHQ